MRREPVAIDNVFGESDSRWLAGDFCPAMYARRILENSTRNQAPTR
jgi:hypothetical protein